MATNRATKSGFAAEAQKKVDAKYSEDLAKECLEWIALITNEQINTAGDMLNFYEVLKDGVLLCNWKIYEECGLYTIPGGQLDKTLFCFGKYYQTRQCEKINKTTMAFKCMENINAFLEVAKELGVPPQETFQTVDLWEKQNLNSVVICLQSLGRKADKYGKPSIGPKEAERNERMFSDEKLKAGQTIIGLQMGSNKGATQSGINFGNTRHM